MTLGRRYELLMAFASRNVPKARREELLEAGSQWLASDACPARTPEELFYLAGAMAGIHIKAYSEHLQSIWGEEVLKDLRTKVDA